MRSGLFVISLDFELFWGLQDSCSVESQRDAVLNVHTAVPEMLDLFDKYNIHATWATVGGILADNKDEWLRYVPDIKPQYDNHVKSVYRLTDVIASQENPAALFFGKSLVDMIKNTPNQEIGSHTFSHFYCAEAGCTEEAFSADLETDQKITSDCSCAPVTSIVFPKNQLKDEYLSVLKAFGFNAYRGLEDNWIHNKIKHEQVVRALRLLNNYLPLTGSDAFTVDRPDISGLYNIKASRFYHSYNRKLSLLEPLKTMRIKGQMRRAAKQNKIYHLWWHPHNFGKNTVLNIKEIEKLFLYFKKLNGKYGMESATMAEVVSLCKAQENEQTPTADAAL